MRRRLTTQRRRPRRHHQTSTRQTRLSGRNPLKKCQKTYIVQTMLEMLRMVKLDHWNTKSYSHHKATDELYERMNDKIDRFTEVYMGKDHKRIGIWNQHMHRMYGSNFSSTVHTFREFLINLDRCFDPTQDSDLLNIRDDLLADVNQFLFLYAMR